MEITFGKILLFYLLAINVFAFILAAVDKYRAKHGMWRIKESTLFLSAILGGSIGLYAAFLIFRHKTKHMSFMIGVPLIFLLQLAIAIYFLFIR